jgi:hypothetical protein
MQSFVEPTDLFSEQATAAGSNSSQRPPKKDDDMHPKAHILVNNQKAPPRTLASLSRSDSTFFLTW